jgi:hypothetical protein
VQPTYEIYPIFTLWVSVRSVPLCAATSEFPRKFAVFLRKKGLFLNGVQKVVSSNLTAQTIFSRKFMGFQIPNGFPKIFIGVGSSGVMPFGQLVLDGG